MRRRNAVKWPTLQQITPVWQSIRADPEGKQALAKLKRDGFAIDHLTPHGPKSPTWADYFASIPFLPNQSSQRHLQRKKTLRKHLPLVNAMRQFAAQANDPFCEIRMVRGNETLLEDCRELGLEFGKAADLIERFISSDWSTRERNPRNTVIASLRWTIRHRTGSSHDSELATLIDAAFVAVGKDCLCLESRALHRIEELERVGRVKAARRLNYVSEKSPTPVPGISRSTRSPRNRAKRV
jgi:hypothetical protein